MFAQRFGLLAVALAFVVLVASCGTSALLDVEETPPETTKLILSPTDTVGRAESLTLEDQVPTGTPGVTRASGENPRRFGSPPGYLFDAIPPVYDPEFAIADEAPLDDDELVMGVEIGGEAKAYSITVLRSREMVNDELGGIPILVTW